MDRQTGIATTWAILEPKSLFSGISSNDQQSLIQQPKGILKTSHDHSRYTESSMDVFTGQQRPRVAGGMVGANTQRSLAESSGSGVSQVNRKDDTSQRWNVKEV